MKNIQAQNYLKLINDFVKREAEEKKAFVNSVAKFKIKKNLKNLMSCVKLYEETLQELVTQYELKGDEEGRVIMPEDINLASQINKELSDLANIEVDIDIVKISDKDFTDNCLISDVMLLDFMTEEVEENE